DLYNYDLTTAVKQKLTSGTQSLGAVWSPDGSQLAYHAAAAGLGLISPSGAPKGLLVPPEASVVLIPSGWSPDGKFVAYTRSGLNQHGIGGQDIWIVPTTSDRKPFAFTETTVNEDAATFSPDGRWIAYSSNDGSGAPQVFVQPFPVGEKTQISRTSGGQPIWS